jgi:hypothetical protein
VDIRDTRTLEIFALFLEILSKTTYLAGSPFFLQLSMVCKNLCERLYSKIVFGKSHYEGGKKYCRRCEIYFYYDGVFCPCCGMALRMSPTSKRDKEMGRQLQLRREEEQDRIIRLTKETKR